MKFTEMMNCGGRKRSIMMWFWLAGGVVGAKDPAWGRGTPVMAFDEIVREAEFIAIGTMTDISLKVANYKAEKNLGEIRIYQNKGTLSVREGLKGDMIPGILLTIYWTQGDTRLPFGHFIKPGSSGIWFLRRESIKPETFSLVGGTGFGPAPDEYRLDVRRLVEKNRWFRPGSGGVIDPFPDSLIEVYGRFMVAVKTGQQGAIESLCLPGCITFTSEPRPEASRLLGQDMNLQFLKSIFDPLIWTIRKEADDLYMIRTSNSIMNFVNTRTGGWKLYRYADKPIE